MQHSARKLAAALQALGQPSLPVIVKRPKALMAAFRYFKSNFPGEVAYPIKANPAPWVLDALYAEGLRTFEVASLNEVAQVAAYGDTEVFFMHPVKTPEDIAVAYHRYGVRIFALDSLDELAKIQAATNHADDLTLCVRLAVAARNSRVPLLRKFGCTGAEAIALLRATRQVAAKLGVTFHVGSQTVAPEAYKMALQQTNRAIVKAGVVVDLLDVGGGFPAYYGGEVPAPWSKFFRTIAAEIEHMQVAENCRIVCEPGRALVAEAESVLLRVNGRRGNELHVNDGSYGLLFDACHLKFAFPHQALTGRQAAVKAFSLWGPTCDSIDYMPGPFHLPEDMAAGDYLEIGNIGAYGRTLASRFNGYGEYLETSIDTAPLASMLNLPKVEKEKLKRRA